MTDLYELLIYDMKTLQSAIGWSKGGEIEAEYPYHACALCKP